MPSKIESVKRNDEARRISEEFRERAQDRLTSNAEYQRRSLMTKEERHRDAVDRMTKVTKDYAERNGKELTDSQARAFAQQVGQKNLRRESE